VRKLTIVFILMISPSLAWSQSVDERFVGTWLLDRIETRSETGDWTRAETRLGANPVGIITYDITGNMAVQIMRPDRPPLSSRLAEGQAATEDALAMAPADEKAIAFDGYTAYFGKYSVRESEAIVVHQRIGHLIPNRATLSVERAFEFVDGTLVLAVPGGNRLVWKRAR
jgi:hypothetical protein